MQRLSLLIAFVVAAVFTPVSFAEEKADKRVFYERLLKTSDKDGDGAITTQEFSEGFARRGRANRSDRRDGEQDRQRRRAGQNRQRRRPGQNRQQGAQYFKRLDKNGDGKVTRDEMPERAQARFDSMVKRLDKDGDGALSGQEFAAQAARGARPQSPGSRNPNAARRSAGQAGRFFALLDADGDGKLTKAEIRKALKLVSQLDTDGDQALSAREILAAPRSSNKAGTANAKKKREGKKAGQQKKKAEQRKRKKQGEVKKGEQKKRKKQGEAKKRKKQGEAKKGEQKKRKKQGEAKKAKNADKKTEAKTETKTAKLKKL